MPLISNSTPTRKCGSVKSFRTKLHIHSSSLHDAFLLYNVWLPKILVPQTLHETLLHPSENSNLTPYISFKMIMHSNGSDVFKNALFKIQKAVHVKDTYLCESSYSNGIDEFVKQKDHLLPVAYESAKLPRGSWKGCLKRETKQNVYWSLNFRTKAIIIILLLTARLNLR